MKGDARSLDYSSYGLEAGGLDREEHTALGARTHLARAPVLLKLHGAAA